MKKRSLSSACCLSPCVDVESFVELHCLRRYRAIAQKLELELGHTPSTDLSAPSADIQDEDAEQRKLEQVQGIVMHQELQRTGHAEGARPTGTGALKPVDLDYIRNVVVKLLETEEIDTYLPILAMLLRFSDEDREVVRNAFSEKETVSFSFW